MKAATARGFVDPGVDQLACGGFLVGQDQVTVHGQVVLASRAIDLRRWEERIHAESPGLIRHDGHDPVPEILVPEQILEQAHK
ncbi:hypothetical protein QF031_000446 [Pseudarthrobacter defluvii]|nr:hypothetical protein [Pseudarthrobacter defluvii]